MGTLTCAFQLAVRLPALRGELADAWQGQQTAAHRNAHRVDDAAAQTVRRSTAHAQSSDAQTQQVDPQKWACGTRDPAGWHVASASLQAWAARRTPGDETVWRNGDGAPPPWTCLATACGHSAVTIRGSPSRRRRFRWQQYMLIQQHRSHSRGHGDARTPSALRPDLVPALRGEQAAEARSTAGDANLLRGGA